jgi:phosphatidate phosphatase APP1
VTGGPPGARPGRVAAILTGMSTFAALAARAEDRVTSAVVRLLSRRGYTPRVVAYPSYGTVDRSRVRARVLLTAPDAPTPGSIARRGWRNLLSAELPDAEVRVRAQPGEGPDLLVARTDRGGYLDAWLDVPLEPGWQTLYLSVGEDADVPAPVQVVDPAATHGIVSDIDDTVLVTMVPRPHLAAWNFLVRSEARRKPVPGMPELYGRLTATHPDAPVFYLSTGAWNTASALSRFLHRVGLPQGSLLLTDLGPTGAALMRSGREHKAATLRRLADELPGLQWILVGDDGQHDPQVYETFAAENPGRVAAIAVRELSVGEQVAQNGLPGPTPATRRAVDELDRSSVVTVHAPDGRALADQLAEAGVIG